MILPISARPICAPSGRILWRKEISELNRVPKIGETAKKQRQVLCYPAFSVTMPTNGNSRNV